MSNRLINTRDYFYTESNINILEIIYSRNYFLKAARLKISSILKN